MHDGMKMWLQMLVVAMPLAIAATTAQAAPVTYNLTFTPTVGLGGTGSFTVNGLTGISAEVFQPGSGLVAMSFDLGSHHIDFADPFTTGEVVTFIDGQLAALVFVYQPLNGDVIHIPSSPSNLNAYVFALGAEFGIGTFSASLAPVPAPGALALLAGGVFGLGLARRHKRARSGA